MSFDGFLFLLLRKTRLLDRLKKIIDDIVVFGIQEKPNTSKSEVEIIKLLIDLYSEYLKIENTIVGSEVNYNDPNFDYNAIQKIVAKNFSNYGWYHSITNSHILLENPDVATGDAIDDLTDIIMDMMEVKWIMENISFKEGLWQFWFLMHYHSEQHLVDLIKYIKDQKG